MVSLLALPVTAPSDARVLFWDSRMSPTGVSSARAPSGSSKKLYGSRKGQRLRLTRDSCGNPLHVEWGRAATGEAWTRAAGNSGVFRWACMKFRCANYYDNITYTTGRQRGLMANIRSCQRKPAAGDGG